MSNRAAKPDDAVSLVPEWVDAIAGRFEAAWQGVTPPCLDDFLGDETGDRRG